MKKVILFIAVLVLFSGSVAMASDYKGMTGDAELNIMLGDLNIYARGDMENFITDLGVSYNVPEADISVLLRKRHMEPADVYMAIRLSNMTGHPPRHIADLYRNNRGRGWGRVAQSLGIKPGSAEFHALKDHGKMKHYKGKKHKGMKGMKHKGGKGKKGMGH